MLTKEKIIELAQDCDKPTGDAFLDDLHAKYNEGSPREDWPHYYRFLYKLAPHISTYFELGFHYGSALHHVSRGNLTCRAAGLDSDPEKSKRAMSIFCGFGIHRASSIVREYPDSFSNPTRFDLPFADYYCADDSHDAILIDTDHTYATTKEEFSLWSPKVKSGGLILFDDIDAPEYKDGCGKFFRELQEQHPDRTLSLPHLHPENWGFGVLIKP